MKKILFYCLLCTMVISCTKNQVNNDLQDVEQGPKLTSEEQHVLDLMDLGEITQITEEHVFIDDCIAVRRSSLQEEHFEQEEHEHGDAATTRARRAVSVNHLISSTNYNIDVNISSSFNALQRAIIIDALDTWENTSGLNFSVITGGRPDLWIIMDTDNPRATPPQGFLNLPETRCGIGEFPSNGRPGRWISINDNLTLDNGQYLANAIHEIGHVIGFAHADVFSPNITCTVTPPANDCNIALMIGNCCSANIEELTDDEEKAATMMYPGDENFSPVITDHTVEYQDQSSRLVTLDFHSTTGNGDKIVDVLRYYTSGTLAQTYSGIACKTNDSYSLTTTPWPGEWMFRVRYRNLRGDITILSPPYIVDMTL